MALNTKSIAGTLILLMVIVVGCKTTDSYSKRVKEFKTNPKLIFLNYSIEKLSEDKLQVELINHKTVNGKLKNFKIVKNPTKDDIICTQLDKKSKIIEERIIKNPLVKNFEFLNDSLSFESKTIELDKSTFSIRLQLKPETKYIIIRKLENDKSFLKTKIY